MQDSSTSSPLTSNASPLLVGVLIDVSSSMKRNWHNQDGRKLPRIEVIRDALNKRIKEEQKRRQKHGSSFNNIEIFCLGMGFRTFMHLNTVELSFDREHHLKDTKEITVANLVCDLIALGEILPSKEKLTDFKTRLQQKWQQCSQGILDRSMITDNVYADLVEYLQKVLYESATEKLHQSIRYRFSGFHQIKWLSQILQNAVKEQEEKIATTSKVASAQYADSVFNKTSKDFRANTDNYVKLIRKHIEEFAKLYTASTLNALTLGFETAELVDDLDETRAIALAKQIQADLEVEVSKHIKLALALHEQKLLAAGRGIAASLNRKEIRRLTEKFIRKFGWDILRPLIEETVSAIFAEQFETQAKASFPYWIQLAAAREVIRPLNQLANVLPDVVEEHVYSEKVMFGSTPFVQTIDKAAIRFINKDYKDRRKVLIIVSDGEFEQVQSALVSVNLLKRRGVTIICCLIADRNILSRLVKHSSKSWPEGAKLMVEIASSASQQDNSFIQWKEKDKALSLTDEKLCFQMNQSSILEDVLAAIFEGQNSQEERD